MGRTYEPSPNMRARSCGYNSWAAPKEWEIVFPADPLINPLGGATYVLEESGPLDALLDWTGYFFRWRGPFILQETFQGWPALWMGQGYRAIAGEPTDPASAIFVGYEPVGLGWQFATGKWFAQGSICQPPPLPWNGLSSFQGLADLDATPKLW